MTGKLFGKAFILLIFYLFLCSLIYFISYFALTKKNFIDIPVFKSIQRNLYYELFVEVWQNKPECVSFDEGLIYQGKRLRSIVRGAQAAHWTQFQERRAPKDVFAKKPRIS